ncbi:MAG TPA: hypothetical protein ENK15_05765 [Thermopetrobacter sp.]|nr:hypothetical protein [Thermopetrobacter sp.]
MMRRTLRLTMMAGALAMSGGPLALAPTAVAQTAAPAFSDAQQWMKAFSDPKWAQALAGPAPADRLSAYLKTLSDPRMMQGMLKAADPKLMGAWLKAAADPKLFAAVKKAGDPALLKRYTDMMADPRLMEGMKKAADPQALENFAKLLSDEAFMGRVTRMAADTQQYADFLRKLMDPAFYTALTNAVDPAVMQGLVKMMTQPGMMEAMMMAMDPDLLARTARLAFTAAQRGVEAATQAAGARRPGGAADPYTEMLKLVLDPAWYAAMYKNVDPALMQQFMKLATTPQMMEALMKSMDPELFARLMQLSFAMANSGFGGRGANRTAPAVPEKK